MSEHLFTPNSQDFFTCLTAPDGLLGDSRLPPMELLTLLTLLNVLTASALLVERAFSFFAARSRRATSDKGGSRSFKVDLDCGTGSLLIVSALGD